MRMLFTIVTAALCIAITCLFAQTFDLVVAAPLSLLFAIVIITVVVAILNDKEPLT